MDRTNYYPNFFFGENYYPNYLGIFCFVFIRLIIKECKAIGLTEEDWIFNKDNRLYEKLRKCDNA